MKNILLVLNHNKSPKGALVSKTPIGSLILSTEFNSQTEFGNPESETRGILKTNKIIKISYLFLLIFSITLFNFSVRAENISNPVVTYAKVDKTEATIGDTITYNLTVEHAKGIKINIPDIKKNLSDFKIDNETQNKSKNVDNMEVDEFVYKIQAQDVSSYIIQPVIISYTVPKELQQTYGKDSSVKTSKIYIEIKSVLKPEDKNKDIQDIKPIENISVLTINALIGIIIGLIILGIGIYFIIKKLRKPKKDLLPHELAYKQLNELKNEKLFESGKSKEFYFKISEIARRYLKNRFEIYALEKTSQELNNELKTNSELNQTQKIFLSDFMEITDFYKFTDAKPEAEKSKEIFKNIYKFVDETKKMPEPEKKN